MRANQTVKAGDLAPGAFEGLDKAARTINGFGTGQNRIMNPVFRGNSRGLSGSIVLGAGAYGHDCWKAGAGGCTYSLSGSTITIASGSLVQVIDGQALTTGMHTLSYIGTAPARINAGQWFVGTQSANATYATNLTLEFGVGSVNLPQLEPGAIATPFVIPHPAAERMALNWYVQRFFVLIGSGNPRTWTSPRASNVAVMPEIVAQPMRAMPSLTMQNANSFEYFASGGPWTTTTVSFICYGATSSPRIIADCPIDTSNGSSVYIRRNAVGDVYAVLSAEL